MPAIRRVRPALRSTVRHLAAGSLLVLALACGSHISAREFPETIPPQIRLDRTAPTDRTAARAGGTPIPTRLLPGIPDVIQRNEYSCGVGVFQAIAMYYGYWGYQDEFVKVLGTTEAEGTHPARIVRGFRKLGFEARLVEGLTIDDLKRHIDAGIPVIIDYQAWGEPANKDYAKEWEDGHYSIAVGYNDQVIFIEDPSLLGTVGYLTHQELMARWHDYEIENGKRREYRQMGIVVRGRIVPQPPFSHID